MLWIQSVFVADQFGDEGENVSLNYTYLHGWFIIARDMHTVRNQYCMGAIEIQAFDIRALA